MLDFMRRKARSPVIQAVVIIIILVFVFWGVGTNQGGSGDVAATVNDQTISVREFQQSYNQLANQYRDQFGGQLPPGLFETLGIREMALEQLIEQKLVRQGARKMGVTVSAAEVQSTIQEMEVFRTGEEFDLDRYREVLSSSRMPVSDFEASVHEDLLMRKVMALLGDFARISDQEVRELFRYEFEEVNLEYLALTADLFRDRVQVDDEGLAAFYEKNRTRYQTAPMIKVQYLSFPLAEHDPGAGKPGSEAFQKANRAYEQIILSGSLKKFAEQEGIGLRETGYFSRQDPPSELAAAPAYLEAAFNLSAGELSSLISGEQGYAIIFAEDVKPPEIPPLAEVEDRVRRDFIADRAVDLARDAARTILAQAKEGADLTAGAGELGLSPRTTGFLSRRQPGNTGLPGTVLLEGLALSGARPCPEEVVESGGTFYVLKFKEKRESVADLAAHEEELRQVLLAREQDSLLSGWLDNLKQQARITRNERLFL